MPAGEKLQGQRSVLQLRSTGITRVAVDRRGDHVEHRRSGTITLGCMPAMPAPVARLHQFVEHLRRERGLQQFRAADGAGGRCASCGLRSGCISDRLPRHRHRLHPGEPGGHFLDRRQAGFVQAQGQAQRGQHGEQGRHGHVLACLEAVDHLAHLAGALRQLGLGQARFFAAALQFPAGLVLAPNGVSHGLHNGLNSRVLQAMTGILRTRPAVTAGVAHPRRTPAPRRPAPAAERPGPPRSPGHRRSL